ncbi:MAG TPA: tetratricopeptide repeat protein [Candidatus Omnitrophica bacterium]|nr:tetratricopeptide repeat protein [Candidatus Omnitrophota bacterium]
MGLNMNKKSFIPAIIIVVFCGLLSYANSFNNDFVWDDDFLITSNEVIKDVANWHGAVTQELLNGTHTNYYRPIQVFSYMLDYRIFGFNPFGYHLHSFLLHILNAILVYILTVYLCALLLKERNTESKNNKTLKRLNFIALFTAVLFVVHPAHCESVSYISGRADLLSAFFILSALLFYIRHFDLFKFSRILYLSSILLFVFSLFSKEMSLIFVPVLIIFEVFLKKDRVSGVKRLLPFIFIAAFYIVLRLTILNFSAQPIFAKASLYSPNSIIRIFSFFKGVIIYLWLLIMPVNLHMERYMMPAVRIFDAHVLTFISIAIILIVFFSRCRFRNKKFFIFNITWFFILLFPQSSFFFIAILADHYLYLPSIGIFMIIAYGLNKLYLRRKYLAQALFISIVVFFGLLTFSQNYVWRNSISFYRWTDKFSPASYITRNNLANIYAHLGMEEDAIKMYERALEINPKIESIAKNKSIVEDNYIKRYKDIIKSKPKSAVHYYNLARLYERKGMEEDAIKMYEQAISINPELVRAINNLGSIYEKNNRFDDALAQYEKAASIDPGFAKAFFNIGVVLANQGKLREAKGYFEKALEIDPDYQKAEESLGRVIWMIKASSAP